MIGHFNPDKQKKFKFNSALWICREPNEIARFALSNCRAMRAAALPDGTISIDVLTAEREWRAVDRDWAISAAMTIRGARQFIYRFRPDLLTTDKPAADASQLK